MFRNRFENDVKMYGTQATAPAFSDLLSFENDVKMYGTQATRFLTPCPRTFENDVKMYGTQAFMQSNFVPKSLRMM